MCGFAGIIDPSGQKTAEHSRLMALALAHRGPDDHTDWQDASLGVALSFRRLAILDLSPDGNQPMHDGPLTICFNGEIYNYKELRRGLEIEFDCTFKTTSDTEVLLKSVLHRGVPQTLALLNGMYGIALLDRRDNTLTLARDRFGEKPLYYTRHGNALYFASELKALRTQMDPKADKTALSRYLQFGFIPAPLTIYENVNALQPGHYITFDIKDLRHVGSGKLHKLLGDTPPYFMDEGDAMAMFANTFTTAVDIRLRSDVPVGVFLSGGLDSSLIMVTANKLLGRSLPSFTIAMKSADAAYDETAQAKVVADACGSEHHVLPLDEAALLNAIPDQIAQMDQPLADAAIIPTALLSRFARQHVTVVLGGEGGDELQAGYTRHAQSMALRALYGMRKIAKPILPFADLAGKNLPQWKRQSAKLKGLLNIEAGNTYEALMTLWPQEKGMDLPSDFRTADTEFYLPHDLLMKADGATMQASLEGRSPYLDPELWAAMTVIPRNFWRGKHLAKRMLEGLGGTLPSAKRGLTLPLAEWLRGSLRGWAETQLAEFKTLNLLPDEDVDAQWNALLDGRSDHAQPIWALCLFSAWRKAHNLSI